MLKQWSELTSCNGVIDLYLSKGQKYHFLFWSITMVIMLGSCIFFTAKTIIGFAQTTTVTNYATKIYTGKTMPEIAFCFNGGLNGSALIQANFSNVLIFGLSETSLSKKVSYQGIDSEFKTYLNETNMNVIQFTDRFGYKCKDMVIERYAADTEHDSNLGCENVTHFPTQVYGMCLLFKK